MLKVIFLFSTLSLFVVSCSGTHKNLTKVQRKKITILATSDFHGSIDRAEAFASTVQELRSKYGPNVVHFDGGDLFQGQLEANLTKGQSVVDLYNFIGVDVAAIGNHELDYGCDHPVRVEPKPNENPIGNLKKRYQGAKFKWISSNFIYTSPSKSPYKNALGQSTPFPPHAVIEKNDIKVCAIGATTPVTKNITRRSFIRGLDFIALEQAITEEATALRKSKNCDFIVLVSHAGLECNLKDSKIGCLQNGSHADILRLLNNIPKGTLDAVIGGHTHIPAAEVINGTPVVVGGSYAQVVGVLHLEKLSDNSVQSKLEPFVPVVSKDKNEAVSELLSSSRKTAEKLKKIPVGKTSADSEFKRIYSEENPITNMVADAIYERISAIQKIDFSAINAGGVRGPLPTGNLNYGDIYKILPFSDGITIARLKGHELLRFLEVLESGGHGRGSVSKNIKISLISDKTLEKIPSSSNRIRDLNNDGLREEWEVQRLLEVIDQRTGRPIDPEKIYTLATLDFLTSGGDHQRFLFDTLPQNRFRRFPDIPAREALKFYLKKHSPVSSKNYYSKENFRINQIDYSGQ